MADDHDRDPVVFNAIITPHRSLTPVGLGYLFAGLATVTGVVAIRFWMLGAWPVLLFGAGELVLIGALLWCNHRSARSMERVTLYPDHARIERTTPSGRRWETALPMAWLTVELDETAHRVTRLWLCHRGRREEIGGSLGETEKRDLASAIRSALDRWRRPQFDNPQLQI